MTQQLSSLARRICYHYPYVAPSTILSADPVNEQYTSSLRDDASSDGVCYFEVTRSFYDGSYLARVAAHPDLIRSEGYTLVLYAVQLAQVRPYDCRMQSKAA